MKIRPDFSACLLWSVLACASSVLLFGTAGCRQQAQPAPEVPAPTVATPPATPAASPGAPVANPIPAPIAAAVAAPDRGEEDRALDAGRKPDEVLAFFGIAPGQRVAELGAGGGYTSELLARVVGANGRVFGQNPQFFLERFAEKPWSERLKKPALANVVRADREFDDPFPPEATALDAVVFVLVYHDTVWFGTDRDRMNRAVFNALKPGGIYGVVDHSGRPGSGTSEARTLHRIDERVVREEVQRAGFVFDAEAAFLRNPSDVRDWNTSPRTAGERRGTSDRFVLRFKKPG
jgi:predicted methyltransferase